MESQILLEISSFSQLGSATGWEHCDGKRCGWLCIISTPWFLFLAHYEASGLPGLSLGPDIERGKSVIGQKWSSLTKNIYNLVLMFSKYCRFLKLRLFWVRIESCGLQRELSCGCAVDCLAWVMPITAGHLILIWAVQCLLLTWGHLTPLGGSLLKQIHDMLLSWAPIWSTVGEACLLSKLRCEALFSTGCFSQCLTCGLCQHVRQQCL